MKQILFFSIIVVMLLTSCSKNLYPDQKESGRKEVPSVTGYFTQVPLVHQVADLKWIHDKGNNAFVLFKGAEDTLLTTMQNWLDKKEDENGDIATPVAKYVETPIAPFTLFTKKDLKKMSKADREKVIELARYRTFSITLSSYLYKEDMSDNELAAMEGRKFVPAQTKITTVTTPLKQPEKKEERPVKLRRTRPSRTD